MDFTKIRESITLIIDTYTTEWAIYLLLIMGVTLIFAGLFMPRDIALSKIDLKSFLDKDLIHESMTDKVKYYHILARSGFFKAFMIDPESKDYAKQKMLILQAGGLGGMTPDVLNLFSYLALFGVLGFGFVVVFVLTVFNLDAKIADIAIGFVVAGALGFLAPELWVKSKIKKRRELLLEELDTIQLFTIIYLKAGYGVYDLVEALAEITYHTKDYFNELRNEYYINTEKSLQNLANKIELEEYQLLIDILKQAVRISGKEMVNFIEGHMRQLKRTKELSKSASNKKKPLMYTFLLALPLVSIIIIWFYPLFLQVMATFKELSI